MQLICCTYRLDFYQCPFWQRFYCYGRAGRVGFGKEFCIDVIHVGKVFHIRQEYSCLHNIVYREASLFKNGFDVVERLTCLLLDVTRYYAASCG